mmetsp:Transcript_32039/g.102065  ORF Transcript_32039/g.102065 Transcript_32039/m.102065 type:complete len:137 (+) Transcript_32039:1630-2040(+)
MLLIYSRDKNIPRHVCISGPRPVARCKAPPPTSTKPMSESTVSAWCRVLHLAMTGFTSVELVPENERFSSSGSSTGGLSKTSSLLPVEKCSQLVEFVPLVVCNREKDPKCWETNCPNMDTPSSYGLDPNRKCVCAT